MTKIDNIKKVSVIGIFCNALLLIIKLIVGIISKSTSMLADAIQSIEDVFCSILSYIGAKISSKSYDDLHPYGFGKVEYVFSLIISITMVLASFSILQTIFEGFLNPQKLNFSIWLIVVCILNILIKFILFLYARFKYNNTQDILLKASMEDHRNDMFLTLVTLIGVTCVYFDIYIVDTIVGIVISIWILCEGVKLFISSYKVLIDTGLSNNILEEIKLDVQKENIPFNVLQIITKPVGDSYIVILKIIINEEKKLQSSIESIEEIKENIKNKFECISDVIVDITIDR